MRNVWIASPSGLFARRKGVLLGVSGETSSMGRCPPGPERWHGLMEGTWSMPTMSEWISRAAAMETGHPSGKQVIR